MRRWGVRQARRWYLLPALALAGLCLFSAPTAAARAAQIGPVDRVDPWFERWETFTVADGLPSDRVLAVAVAGEDVWVGTDRGLTRLRAGRFESFGTDDGLPFPVVVGIDVDPITGDVWVATLGGLARWSAGRIDAFTQLNSGLANDVVYAVAVDGESVWAATAVGLSRYDTVTAVWEIFDVSNTLMHEPWCYGLTVAAEKIYVAVWGGGVVERDKRSGQFREHRDPDGEMEIDLFRDDGLVHDVTSAVDAGGGLLWVGTYFGLSRYDGRRWQSYGADDSGLVGDFINALAADAAGVWIATDQGLSRFDSVQWHSWSRGDDGGVELMVGTQREVPRTVRPRTGPASNTIYGVESDGRDVWLATAAGLSHGLARQPLVSSNQQEEPEGARR